MDQAIEFVDACISSREHHYICVAPAHSVMDCYRDQALRQIFNRSCMVTPDGMSIVWLLRLMGYRNVDRVYGPDLMLELCRHSTSKGRRHYFYGGGPGVTHKLVQHLTEVIPGLQIAGHDHPPEIEEHPKQDPTAIDKINAAQADIIWLGFSSPKQERWMAEHLSKINSPLMIGVGATFDFLSGSKPQAPRWVQRGGLEWLFRLKTEPRRLWPRYRQYPLFLLLVLAQLLGLRKYPL